MKTRRLLFLLPISLLGYLAFFYLFPRLNTSATWRHELDRATAIEKARRAAEQFDFDLNGCTVSVDSDLDRNVEFYLRNYPEGKFGSFLTGVSTSVRFVDYRGRRNFKATFNSRGGLLGIEKHRRPLAPPPKPETQPSPSSEADRSLALGIAEKALVRVLGDHSKLFVGPPTISEERSGLRFNWVASDEQLRVIAEVSVHDGNAPSVKVTPAATTRFRGLMEGRQSNAVKSLLIADGLVIWPSLIAVIIVYFIGLARRQINHRRTLLFFLLCFLYFIFVTSLGSFLDDLRTGNIQFSGGQPPAFLEASIPLIIFVLASLILAAGMYFLYAAGSSLYTERSGLRALDLTLAIKAKLWTAPVARSFLGGLLAGGALCVIPYLTAASPLSPGMMISGNGLEKSFVSRAPALVSSATFGLYSIFLVFGFVAPLIAALISRASFEKWLLHLCVWLVIVGSTSPSFSLSGALVSSILSAFLLIRVYFEFGVLSVLITVMASQAAVTAASLLVQPNDSLRASGWRVIAGIAGAFAVGLIGLWKARPVQPGELSRDMVGLETQAERDRLKAEFEVAARAQQHMLPDAPPSLPGLRISAVCLPSKEVGGDLYDFLSLPNGKVGVVVADVSGKGVPASLYMTLTKGLLDSISEDKYDPGEILREANRHLYDTCKRKMFVTLFLGVIDPIDRTLTYARAGHNPTIFRRPSEQSTTMLKSRGMGLGLNRGKLFDQSLRVESVHLAPGDKLFFYSDGITEAMNRKNEEYGEERLMTAAAATDQMTAVEARDAILTNVSAFLSGNSPQDDQTLIVVEVTA